jgi:hypothetical protein
MCSEHLNKVDQSVRVRDRAVRTCTEHPVVLPAAAAAPVAASVFCWWSVAARETLVAAVRWVCCECVPCLPSLCAATCRWLCAGRAVWALM